MQYVSIKMKQVGLFQLIVVMLHKRDACDRDGKQ